MRLLALGAKIKGSGNKRQTKIKMTKVNPLYLYPNPSAKDLWGAK